MIKSLVIFAVFSMLFSQFVHAAVLDATDAHQNSQNIDLSGAHYHDHGDDDHDLDHDDDHGLGWLHNALHDLQTIALPIGLTNVVITPGAAKQSLHGSNIYRGLSISPPVPPPLT